MNFDNRLREAMRDLTGTEPPDGAIERIVKSLPDRPNRQSHRFLVAAAAVTVLVALLGIALVSRPGPSPDFGQASIGLTAPPKIPDATSTTAPACCSPTPTGLSPTLVWPTPTGLPPTLPAPTLPAGLPTPVPGESLAESDEFWDHWAVFPHFAELPFQASSVTENAELAHLVIRGHIVDVYIGEEIEYSDPDLPPSRAIVYVKVAIGEVLKGQPVSRTPGYVEVQLGFSPPQLESIRASLPQHDALWFLMHEETLGPRPPEHESEIAPFAYFGSNDLQGVIRNVDGEVRVIRPDWIEEVFDADFFPLPLEGTSFDELVGQVRGHQASESTFERSLSFWDLITGGEHPIEIRSLEEAIADADLIVVGRFTGMRFGEFVFSFEVSRSTIAIDEVLKGDPQTLAPGTITLQGLPVRDPDLALSLMPEHQHLLFLHYVPWELERDGLLAEQQEEELYDYSVLSGTQGLILDIDGTARALDPSNPARFPGMLEGEPFSEVVDATRLGVSGAGTPPN